MNKERVKISYVTHARIPTPKAHGYQIMKMCESFKVNGCDIELFVPNLKDKTGGKDPYDYYGIKKIFNIRRLWVLNYKVPPSLGKAWFFLQRIIFTVSVFLKFILKSRRILIYTRDELICLLATFMGYNVIYEIHTWSEKNFLLNLACKFSYRIITITHFLKNEIISKGIESNKILVSPDAVDKEKFNIFESREVCRKKLGLPEIKKLVVYTGHLYPWKGVFCLADAAKLLPSEYLTVLVGGLPADIKKMEQYLRDNNIPNVLLVGHQPFDRIPQYLKSADCLVLPNTSNEKISKNYTSPLKLFEYMASCRPIIVSRLPSIREVVNEKSVVFFESGNAKDLSRKIIEILEQPIKSKELANNSFELAQGFTWRRRVINILKFI